MRPEHDLVPSGKWAPKNAKMKNFLMHQQRYVHKKGKTGREEFFISATSSKAREKKRLKTHDDGKNSCIRHAVKKVETLERFALSGMTFDTRLLLSSQ